MHGFVRFRECPTDGPRRRFAAWFEPAHNTLEPGAAIFAKRFGDMGWMIATRRLTAQFQDGTASFGPAAPRPDRTELEHCRWWLGLELAFIRPKVALALAATAAFALTGNQAPLAARRGTVEVGLHEGPVLLSWHPAYILRLTGPALQTRARDALTQDLRAALAMVQA